MARTKQKGKIRHVAVMSNDHDKLARFYTEVMGLEEVSRGGNPPGNTVYLTDGNINLAIIGIRPGSDTKPGVNHIGFKVDSLDEKKQEFETLDEDMKVEVQQGLALHGQFFEAKYLDPEGFLFDVSESGWPGTPDGHG